MPRALLIEDEAVLRSSMARALRKAPGADEAASALLRKDDVSALRAFRRADELKPGDGRVDASLARRHDMGIVDPDTGV